MAKNQEQGRAGAATPHGAQPPEQPGVKFVMMRRTTDGDGPHPIHPDEVENYRRGDWVEVDSSQV